MREDRFTNTEADAGEYEWRRDDVPAAHEMLDDYDRDDEPDRPPVYHEGWFNIYQLVSDEEIDAHIATLRPIADISVEHFSQNREAIRIDLAAQKLKRMIVTQALEREK